MHIIFLKRNYRFVSSGKQWTAATEEFWFASKHTFGVALFRREAEEVEHQTMIDLLEPQHPVRLHTRNGTRKGYAMGGIQQYMK